MKPILILKTGDTFDNVKEQYGDFEDWIIKSMELDRKQVEVFDIRKGEKLPKPGDYSGIVITGSHDDITDYTDHRDSLLNWLQPLYNAEIPILGICYGHQALATAFGGSVDYHPEGPEVESVELELTDEGNYDILFKDINRKFPAHASHGQTVTILPENSVVLAYNDFEPHHAVRYCRNAWGLQFHPEYDPGIMEGYIRKQDRRLSEAEIERLLTLVTQSNESRKIMLNFREVCEGKNV